MTAGSRPRLLIISFSPLISDARVLKQIHRLVGEYEVTTCGYGPAPEGVADHVEIPRSASYQDLNGRLITLRLYRLAYWRISDMCTAQLELSGRRFEVILANEPETVPIALRLRPRYGVLADLHEYSPRLNEELPAWKARIAPWFRWLIRSSVSRCAWATTVSPGLIEAYRDELDIATELVTNAAPYADLEPSEPATPLRLVHAGACLRNRQLEVMIDAVEQVGDGVTLDLYLTPNHPDYLAELEARLTGHPRIRLLSPVPYRDLITTLNDYDVGIHLLPPTNFNNARALPNKLFDFVQARLAIVIGPSPDMSRYVDAHGLGRVAAGFTADDLAETLRGLTVEEVARAKRASHTAARELAGEVQVEVWAHALERMRAGDSLRGSRR
jgi:hypothetical protein